MYIYITIHEATRPQTANRNMAGTTVHTFSHHLMSLVCMLLWCKFKKKRRNIFKVGFYFQQQVPKSGRSAETYSGPFSTRSISFSPFLSSITNPLPPSLQGSVSPLSPMTSKFLPIRQCLADVGVGTEQTAWNMRAPVLLHSGAPVCHRPWPSFSWYGAGSDAGGAPGRVLLVYIKFICCCWGDFFGDCLDKV